MLKCRHCDAVVEESDKHCAVCGASVSMNEKSMLSFPLVSSKNATREKVEPPSSEKIQASIKMEEKRRKRMYRLHGIASVIKSDQRYVKSLLACAVIADLAALSGSIFFLLDVMDLMDASILIFRIVSFLSGIVLINVMLRETNCLFISLVDE